MGGSGSGRHWHCGAKSTTEDYLGLDIRKLQRDKVLKPGDTCTWTWRRAKKEIASIGIAVQADCIVLSYRNKSGSSEWQDMKYAVHLEWTPCHFGGKRAWFRCPAVGCGRRVAILYGGKIFACRHCHQLAYESQREHLADRAARKLDRIRDRLKWQPGFLNGKGEKPKRMCWRTFERLQAEHDSLERISLNAIAQKIGMFEP